MRSASCAALLLLALAVPGLSQNKDPYASHVAATPPRSPADEQKQFELPPGFVAELVAAEPDIHKPLNLAFDDRGRLWVTETVEYPFPAGPGKKPRDAVKILSDFGPDGRARKVTTFADGLNIPIGVLPLPAARPQDALVYSIPNVYRLRDAKGDGHATGRELLYAEYGYRDTHGMTSSFTWGFDGWVYACHGYANTSTIKAKDGSAITMSSGNTYRVRPDGSHIEQFTHGQVNPFGLCFDPLGNLYSADCHSQPIYQLLRGGYYPSFGKPDDGLGFAPEMFTGYKGSTAISGIVYYAADHFPAAYRGDAFIGDVVTNEIVQFHITWHGSTPRAEVRPFLRSKDPWFRPVDIKLGPDGALYVADFYNRIIGHYEVPLDHPGRDRERGRVWRIVYRGEKRGTPAPRADWTAAPVEELVKDLGHPNLTVRTKATNQLVVRGGKSGVEAVTAALRDEASPWRRLHGLWVLERCGALAEADLAAAAKDKAVAVRVHAQRVLSERGRLTAGEHALALAGLKDGDANVRRAAADALGRHPAPENVRPLLDLRHAVPGPDTHLLYVVRMALRDQLRPADTWAKLPLRDWPERDRAAVADVSLGVPSPEAAAYLLEYVKGAQVGRDLLTRAVHHVARHGKPEAARALLDFTRGHHPDDLGLQVALLRALERGDQERGGKLEGAAREWAEGLTGKLLASPHGGDVQAGVEVVGALRLKGHDAKLAALATAKKPEGQRKAALEALAALDARKHAATLGGVLADAGSPFALREHAANLLARANQPETRAQLVQALPAAPARLQNVIAAALAGSRPGAEKLLEAVTAGKASARLLQEPSVVPRLGAANVPGLKERVAKLTHGLPPADQRLQDLLRRRRAGFVRAKADAALGAQVFEKSCAICHQV
ncbi:MAG TPA: PVC-type heme-binding CxxCH protein, partial [Gemmataceae bacterium]|nr:PVC-type heme-binding CxxCH protein [Gemmataceae bacterium]